MYTSEYDLFVAEDRSRARRDEMRAIRLARTAQTATADRPSLFDRLAALASRGAHVQARDRKVVATA